MDNYITELANVCKLPYEDIIKSFKLIWFGRSGLYVSNIKKIIDYRKECVVLKIKNNTLEICGKDIHLSQINQGEVFVRGEIYSVSLGVNNEKK